ncbi:DUF1992 domain-containing protein [Herbiconiux moechotypicola]|uniref:DnaJ homologue subfamily C member 28 conserved domain-containing protein n=1 Tax=Herbiconiux moechotypicola TaxID=637393 RepID=A0ABN3DNF7_9MICO|nr:DUF1992 domain-containing protein [Herbiconiux moechotypicola]MCS5730393.1 DUF1992 domain-containing protein [Herbiconiux moechotypicola]
MAAPREPCDSRLHAARYRVTRLDHESSSSTEATGDAAAPDAREPIGSQAGSPTADQRAHFVEIQIRQAMRRGDFDDLPGAGKPLTGLGPSHDPDWWIRRKIEREQLTGLGPPALTLRTEHAELDDRLDRLHTEREVRDTLHDFNRRVIEARRQLLGGPPVITPTRDVETEVAAWRDRRSERSRRAADALAAEQERWRRMSRRERRAARRAGAADPTR